MAPIHVPAEAGWPRAVIFDLDGTLVDSAPDIAVAVNAVLADHDIVIAAADVRRFVGNGARKLIERVFADHDRSVGDAELDRLTEAFAACYRERPCDDSTVFSGALVALDRLRAAGVKTAICTNKPQPIAKRVLARLDLERRVDVLIGAGVHPLKPDPAPLIACLEALTCDAGEALYIGDMAVDRQAGHAVGLPVLLTDFGYSATPVGELGAEGVLTDWAALENALAELFAGIDSRQPGV